MAGINEIKQTLLTMSVNYSFTKKKRTATVDSDLIGQAIPSSNRDDHYINPNPLKYWLDDISK